MFRFGIFHRVFFGITLSVIGVSFASLSYANNSVQVEYRQIKKLEEKIPLLAQELASEGFSSQDFYKKVIQPLNEGEDLDEDYLKSWEEKNFRFHQARYRLDRKKQHYFMVLTHLNVLKLIETLDSEETTSLKEKRYLAKKLTRFESLFDKWSGASEALSEGANPKEQRDRLYSFDEYFKKLRKFLIHLKKAPKIKTVLAESNIDVFEGATVTGASGIYLFLQTLVRNAGIHVSHCFPKSFRKACSSAFTRPNHTSLTTETNTFFHGIEQLKGFQVTVHGKKNLKKIDLNADSRRKVVNLFLPSHRHSVADAILIAKLNLPHFLLFANAVSVVGNQGLAYLLATLPEFISVGQQRGLGSITPTEKVLKALRTGRSPNIVNYPQGFISGTGEILPLNGHFVSTLLKDLITNGYRVNVIPISYEVDPHFLSLSEGVDKPEISATIHPPLKPHAVKALVMQQIEAEKEAETREKQKLPNGRYFDHFLETLWYESIQKFPELSLDQFLDRAQQHLGLGFDPELTR